VECLGERWRFKSRDEWMIGLKVINFSVLGWLKFEWWCMIYKASKVSRWWVCWCSMGCGPERFLELWLRIRVKHVAFYGLWPRMTFLELWLGIADEHEEPLSCGSSWWVLPVWVCWLWPVRMGLEGLPSSMIR